MLARLILTDQKPVGWQIIGHHDPRGHFARSRSVAQLRRMELRKGQVALGLEDLIQKCMEQVRTEEAIQAKYADLMRERDPEWYALKQAEEAAREERKARRAQGLPSVPQQLYEGGVPKSDLESREVQAYVEDAKKTLFQQEFGRGDRSQPQTSERSTDEDLQKSRRLKEAQRSVLPVSILETMLKEDAQRSSDMPQRFLYLIDGRKIAEDIAGTDCDLLVL